MVTPIIYLKGDKQDDRYVSPDGAILHAKLEEDLGAIKHGGIDAIVDGVVCYGGWTTKGVQFAFFADVPRDMAFADFYFSLPLRWSHVDAHVYDIKILEGYVDEKDEIAL